ncbi:unnamed protein product, partial [Rotaria magnacalcarata]
MVTVACVKSTPLPNEKLAFNELRSNNQLLHSFTDEQRSWWTSIRDPLIGAVVSTVLTTATGGAINPLVIAGVLGKRNVDDDINNHIQQFFDSLSPQQRSWWTSIRDPLVAAVIGTAVTAVTGGVINPLVGGAVTSVINSVGKRNVDDDINNHIQEFFDSLSPQQRSWWTSIRDP